MATRTPAPNTTIVVSTAPSCDICPIEWGSTSTATVDGKLTATSFARAGQWASMCETHFLAYGSGLGLGKGQRYIVTA